MEEKIQGYVGYIYKIINSVNDKIYIGQTRVDLGTRWSQHKYSMRHEKHKPLYRAMSRYGYEKFSIVQLEEIYADTLNEVVEKLNDKEKYYISLYNTLNPKGYNLTIGGNQTSMYFTKAVDAYNASGKLMYSFNSIVEARKALGRNEKQHHGISECCKGKSESALGFIWRYHEDSFDKYPIKVTQLQLDRYNNQIPVDQYSLDGVFIASYSKIADALLAIKKPAYGPIKTCCEGITNKAYGYVWRFKGESFDKYQKHYKSLTPIDVYDLEGNLIGHYNSVNNAARALGLNASDHSSITYCCKGYNKTCGGFVWRYAGDAFNKYTLEHKPREQKSVCRYTIEGQFIDQKTSANQYASHVNAKNGTHILNACRGKTHEHIAYGYKWYFADDLSRPA